MHEVTRILNANDAWKKSMELRGGGMLNSHQVAIEINEFLIGG